jgi:hypothetical protein
MESTHTILLTPYNYVDWKPRILHQLKNQGLYRLTMETKVEPDSPEEKNDFLNRQDMALGCICLSISPKIQYHVESLSTPDELWTRLEVLFGNKEDCEDCMQEIEKIEPAENPPEDQASQFEETSTQVSAHPFVPFIRDDVYSISDLFLNHIQKVMDIQMMGIQDDEPQQMPKWVHSTLQGAGDLVGDPPDQRRMRSQFEEPPHSLATIEPMMHMHCYMVQASNPHPYAEVTGNLLENQTRDLVPLPSERNISGADGSIGSRGTRKDRFPKDFIRSIQTSTSSTKSSSSITLHICEVSLE